MQHVWRRAPALALFSAVAIELTGCASPGPPRAPSLQIPRLVSDVSAVRSGDTVLLRFTVPVRTTDGQLLRETVVNGSLCRQIGSTGPCIPVDEAETRHPLSVPTVTSATPVLWTDNLPEGLRSGPPRPVAYRLELRNSVSRSAGLSDPVYAAAGSAPPPVAGLRAEGTRLGVELQWTPVPGAGEVLIERDEPVSPGQPLQKPASQPTHGAHGGKAAKSGHGAAPNTGRNATHKEAATPGRVMLQAAPGDLNASATIDREIQEDVPYRYSALRRETVQLGNRTLELRSSPSPEVSITWRDVYPPPAPTGLTGVGYQGTADAKTPADVYGVDLVWQPVEYTRLAGYVLYREPLNAAGEPVAERRRLTPEPVLTPGYHDASAQPGVRYRYSVTAIDPKGHESGAAQAVVEPAIAP